MSLRADHPDWPHRTLQVLPHLQISQALQVGEEAHAGLAGDTLQLEAAEVLVAIKHVLSGRPCQQQVDQALTAVSMDRVCNQLVSQEAEDLELALTYQTLLHVLPLRDDIARTLGQHHGVEERHNVIFSPEYLVEIILQICL